MKMSALLRRFLKGTCIGIVVIIIYYLMVNMNTFKIPALVKYNEGSRVENTLEVRRRHKLEQCLSFPNHEPQNKHPVIFNVSDIVSSCRVPKSGSTSVVSTFKKLKTTKCQRKFNETKRLIVVRHPLDRLVSGFKEKYNDGHFTGRELYFLNHRLPLLIYLNRVYVPANLNSALEKNMKDYGENGYVWKKSLPDVYSKQELDMFLQQSVNTTVTFTDFLRYLFWSIDKKIVDLHYQTIYHKCMTCTVDYDYILHLYFIEEEFPYVMEKIGFSSSALRRRHISPSFHTFKNISKVAEYENSIEMKYLSYYKDVPKHLYNRILDYYDVDFKTYGFVKPTFEEINNMF